MTVENRDSTLDSWVPTRQTGQFHRLTPPIAAWFARAWIGCALGEFAVRRVGRKSISIK